MRLYHGFECQTSGEKNLNNMTSYQIMLCIHSLCKNSNFKLRKYTFGYLFRLYPTIICRSQVYIYVCYYFKSVIIEVSVRVCVCKSFALSNVLQSYLFISVCVCSTLWLIYTFIQHILEKYLINFNYEQPMCDFL